MKCINLLIAIFCVAILKAQIPSINNFSPLSGPIGTTVTINGLNFSPIISNNIVYFGATKATVLAASTTSLSVIVNNGATYENISVTNLTSHLTAYSSKKFNITFPCGNIINANSFTANTNLITTGASTGLTVNDFDGDGKSDLAVACGFNQPMSIFRNTGTGSNISFAPKVDFVCGSPSSSAQKPIAADFDGDGKLDIAVMNGTTVEVLRNTSTIGSVSFSPFYSTGGGSEPILDIATADINGDGKLEIIIYRYWGYVSKLNILRNNSTVGNISFSWDPGTPTTTFSCTSPAPNIAVSDIDGDKKPDIVVPSCLLSVVSVFLNTSSASNTSFANKIDLPTGYHPGGVYMGDFDSDGKQDLAVSNNDFGNGNTISILRNTSTIGSLSFASKVDYVTPTNIRNIDIDDIDGDGKVDLMIGTTSATSILKNNSSIGSLLFANKVDYNYFPGDGKIALGNLNNENGPEFIVLDGSSQKVYKNQNGNMVNMTSQNTKTICSGDAFYINLTSDLPASYQYIATNNLNTIGESITTQTGNLNQAGIVNTTNVVQTVIYTITPTSSVSTCSGTNQTFSLTVNPSPPVSANASSTSICPNNSVIFTGVGATSYTWSSGINNGVSFPVNSTQTYSVTGMDGNGCINTAAVTITVNPLPVVVANAIPNKVCAGNSTTLTASGASTYSWSTGISGNSIVVSPPGTTNSAVNYTVTGTDSNGCKNNAVVTVTVDVPTIAIYTQTSCIVITSTLIATGANTYTWSTSEQNQYITVNPLNYTLYSVSGTNIYGCSSTNSILVGPNPTANFNYTVTNMTVGFEMKDPTNCTSGGFLWDYGNGMTSTIAQQPFVTYNNSGVYTACLKCNSLPSNCVICANITVPGNYSAATSYVGIEEIQDNNIGIKIYPNPNDGFFTIESKNENKVIINNVLGENIHSQSIQIGKNSLNLNNQPNGIYFIKIQNFTYKIIVQN